MTKQEIQKRVSKNGKSLSLDDFEWDEKTNTFSSVERLLALNFSDISGCTFKTGSGCTFKASSDCIFKIGEECVVVRRDIYGIIELKENQKIKLNGFMVKGFTLLEDEPKETILIMDEVAEKFWTGCQKP